MNTTFVGLELRRVFRDPVTLFFVVALPAFLYLIFGTANDMGDEWTVNGNVSMFIMVSMAAYGAVTATVGIGGMAAVERLQGWGRQLGLTPLTDVSFVLVKTVVSVFVASLPIAGVFVLGWLTGARGDVSAWVLSGLAILLGAVTFALFGLAVGLAFRTESAVGAAGGVLVILAFLGNLFFPLSGVLLTIARFTPLYGYATLARYPVSEGVATDGRGNLIAEDPLWLPVLNVTAWTLIFAVVSIVLVRRGRARQ